MTFRKVAASAAVLLWGATAFAVEIGNNGEHGLPLALPQTALPVQPSLPFADVLQAVDPLQAPAQVVPQSVDRLMQNLAPQIKAAADGNSTSGGAASAGENIQNQMGGGKSQEGSEAVDLPRDDFEPPSAIGTGGVVKAPLPNPGRYYAQAFEEAAYRAQRKGIAREGVTFERVTGNIPAFEGVAHLMYSFDARQAGGKPFKIYVDYSPRWKTPGQSLGLRSTVYAAPTDARAISTHQQSLPGPIIRLMRASPETALRLAREKMPTLSADVSFKVGLIGGDPWYVFYDSRGGQAAVHARTGQVSVLQQPSPKRGAGEKFRALRGSLKTLVKKVGAARPRLSPADIEAAAAAVAQYKGMPWSRSEYDGERFNAANALRSKGATKAQMELFERLLEEAPIHGGHFNRWDGD